MFKTPCLGLGWKAPSVPQNPQKTQRKGSDGNCRSCPILQKCTKYIIYILYINIYTFIYIYHIYISYIYIIYIIHIYILYIYIYLHIYIFYIYVIFIIHEWLIPSSKNRHVPSKERGRCHPWQHQTLRRLHGSHTALARRGGGTMAIKMGMTWWLIYWFYLCLPMFNSHAVEMFVGKYL